MKEGLKKSNGITLVALVITIIVLLILAMVSIRIVLDGGLISKTKEATDIYKVKNEEEQIQLAYASYNMSKNSTSRIENVTGQNLTDLNDLSGYFKGDISQYVVNNDEESGEITLNYNGEEIIVYAEDIKYDGQYTYIIFYYNGYYYKITTEYVKKDEDKDEYEDRITKIDALNRQFIIDNATITNNSKIKGWDIVFNDTQNKYEVSDDGTIVNNAWWIQTKEEKNTIVFDNEAGVYWIAKGTDVKVCFIWDKDAIMITKKGSNSNNDDIYICIITDEGRTKIQNLTNANFEKYIWYYGKDDGTGNIVDSEKYTGISPITTSDVSQIISETYLKRVMDSFNK